MNKKILLSLGSLVAIVSPIAAVVSCSNEKTNASTNTEANSNKQNRIQAQASTSQTPTIVMGHNSTVYTTEVKTVLKDSNYKANEHFDTSAVGSFETGTDVKQIVNVVDKIDDIKAPSVIAVNNTGFNVVDKMEFLNNFGKVYVNDSSLVTYQFLNDTNGDWAIDAKGTITKIKANSNIELKVTSGTTSATIKIVQRAKIVDHKLANLADVATDSHISFASPWGTTTSATFGKFADTGNEDVLKVHIADTQEASGGAKAYGKIDHMKDMANKMSFDSTVNYIALKVFIPQSMMQNKWWFRAYFDGGQLIDMNPQGKGFKQGWNTFCMPVDHSAFTAPVTSINTLKLVAMNSSLPAVSGDLYVEGFYVSDEEIKDL